MTESDNMSSEKSPALYTTKIPLDEEETKKQKVCSRTLLTCILAAILVVLCIVLTIEFLYPVEKRYNMEDMEQAHFYKDVEVHQPPNDTRVDSSDEKAPWHLDFLINPTRLCETVKPPDSESYLKDPEIKLLMLVPSATGHFLQRKTIRRTWGSVAQKPQSPFRLGFILGVTANSTQAQMIEEESVAFGDIIQADFEDTYRNLTTKSVLMMKWVSKHCPHAQYFLKADDDTFVNLHAIAQILQREPYQSDSKFISGFIHNGAQPFRDQKEKYYVSEEDYPGSEFPPYASGSAYLSTGPTVADLFEASKEVKPWIPLEDVFVTGLCADNIDATLLHEPNFLFQQPPKPISWDVYSSLATAHSVTPDDIDQIWNEMLKRVFKNLGFPEFGFFVDDDPFLGGDSLSDLLVFPERNTGGLFDFPDQEDVLSQLLGGKRSVSSGISSFSSVNAKAFPISGSIIDVPVTDIFNLTVFLRK